MTDIVAEKLYVPQAPDMIFGKEEGGRDLEDNESGRKTTVIIVKCLPLLVCNEHFIM